MEEIELFPCYSLPMRNYLTSKGIKYKIVGLHPESKKMFWVYIKDNYFKQAVEEWSKK